MACIVMAYIVMAYMVMACVIMTYIYSRDGCVDAVHVNVDAYVGTGGNLHKSTQTVRQDTAWHTD